MSYISWMYWWNRKLNGKEFPVHLPSIPAAWCISGCWFTLAICVLYVQACVHVCGVVCESVCLCVRYCACAGVSVLKMCTFLGIYVACVLSVFLWMFVFLLHIVHVCFHLTGMCFACLNTLWMHVCSCLFCGCVLCR